MGIWLIILSLVYKFGKSGFGARNTTRKAPFRLFARCMRNRSEYCLELVLDLEGLRSIKRKSFANRHSASFGYQTSLSRTVISRLVLT